VPATLHHVADLVLRDQSVCVEINQPESCRRVKVRIALEVLSGGLGGALRADHGAHEIFKGLSRGEAEHVVFAVHVDAPVRAGPSAQHRRVVRVLWGKRLGKLSEVKSSIFVLVVPLEKQVAIVEGHVNTDIAQTVLYIEGRDCTQVVDVENAESVVGVEVVLLHSLVLRHLYVFVQVHLLANHSDYSLLCLLSHWLVEAARNIR